MDIIGIVESTPPHRFVLGYIKEGVLHQFKGTFSWGPTAINGKIMYPTAINAGKAILEQRIGPTSAKQYANIFARRVMGNFPERPGTCFMITEWQLDRFINEMFY